MSIKAKNQFACSRMMLPEHCNEIGAHRAAVDQGEKCRRPLIDEQRSAELQQILEEAISTGLPLEITCLNESGYHTYGGKPLKTEDYSGLILVDGGAGRALKIKAADITDLKPL